MQTTDAKFCTACGKTIRGRSDKRFCDDYCRNLHHNKKKQEHSQRGIIKELNAILFRNRSILASLFGSDHHVVLIEKSKLIEMGFAFRFLTHTERSESGIIYLCCYEFLYTEINKKKLLIAKTENST
jgi:predicted nucleic acid-binding Zn ribbon protein